MRKKVWLAFLGILLVTLVAGVIDWPKGPNINVRWGDFSWQKELKLHLGLDLQGGTQLVYEADMSDIPAGEQDNAIEGVRDVIERRVNALGVSEPLVQTNKTGDTYRIIIELAGVTDINQAIEAIGETPSLDFREAVISEDESQTDEENTEESENSEEQTESEPEAYRPKLRLLKDPQIIAQATEENSENTPEEDNAGETDSGSSESIELSPEGLQVQGEGEDAQITDSEGNPIDIEALLQQQQQSIASNFTKTELSGKQFERADLQFDPNTGQPTVVITFNNEGKELFKQITERNIGQPVGIFLDNQLISAPRVNQVINDGVAVISGDFDVEEARTLSQRLNAGALPVPIEQISQTTVGPTLGQESIQNSFIAAVLGLILVSIFMIAYYRLPGLLSVFALAAYSLIVLALFKMIPVTLTLAGIAGFILSIGMAVDANVLIFERTREEIRNGKTYASAIESGFKHAWTSIRDSNISSIITCLILIWFGTSIITGFAVTLIIGILVSMFSAITITRTLMRLSATKFISNRKWLYR